jgi:lipoprotein-anchoring transpeptidase ErfK/SrfK
MVRMRLGLSICLVAAAAGLPASGFALELAMADINGADPALPQAAPAAVVRAQVLLDRAGFSSGMIDGRLDGNFTNALRAFQQQTGIPESGDLDPPTWAKLVETSPEPALKEYVISREDVRGPFVSEIPDDYAKQAALKELAYTGPGELLAEKFHMDESLLTRLNPGKRLDRAGTRIVVANVRRPVPQIEVTRLVVDKAQGSLRAFDRDGRLVAYFPASLGEKPTLRGTLKITRVVQDPVYYYNPKFRFPGVTAQRRLKIAPGPNNPVGSVWMNLDRHTYGIHGTAEPAKVGRAPSHGCVRLTNWDARALAAMVKKGTTVEFTPDPPWPRERPHTL